MGSLLFRCFAVALFCSFAYLPMTFGYHAISQLFSKHDGSDFFFFHLGLLLVSGSLTYFCLLLAYRAFAGNGRKKDGELLPPMVMKAFALILIIVWIAALGLKIYERDWITAVYIIFCLAGLGSYSYSKFKRSEKDRTSQLVQ